MKANMDNKKKKDSAKPVRKLTYKPTSEIPFKKKPAATSKPKVDDGTLRLNKYIANSGKCSRREADLYISSGNVTVNGQVVNELGYKVKRTDEVRFDGSLIIPEKKVYVLLNKPVDFVTDPRGDEKSVFDLTRTASKSFLKPVGRLHKKASGLILLTNDIEMQVKLTNHLTRVKKVYHVVLDKKLKAADFEKIAEGVKLEDGFIKPEAINYVENASANEIGIQIPTSKNTAIQRLFEHFQYKVLKLDRVIFADLTKKDLDRGRWRFLNEKEIINLKNLK
ncbi:MAG: pseudouridine synthase [Bacteroidetes bacterium]|nr:pseudouridine synthase [Bacteroidota bacterium]